MNKLNFPEHHRSPHALAALVAGWHGVSLAELASPDPMPRIASARLDLIQILQGFTALSEEQIGVAMGRRPAGTIRALARLAALTERDDQVTRLRLVSLRSAALGLPFEGQVSPEAMGSVLVMSGTKTLLRQIEGLVMEVLSAIEVLREPKLSAEDARLAAFSLLTKSSGMVPHDVNFSN